MRDIIVCPNCRKRLQLRPDGFGRLVQCPACKAQFQAEPDRLAGAANAGAVPGPPEEASPSSDAERYEPVGEFPRRAASSRRTWDPDALSDPRGLRTRKPVRNRIGWIVAAVIGGLVVFGVLLPAWLRRDPPPPFRVANREDDEQRRREIMEAFRNQQPLAEDEIAKELKPLFDGLADAFRAADPARIAGHFDLERLLDELMAEEVFPRHLVRQRGEVVRGMRLGFGQALVPQAPLLAWTRFDIKHLKKLEGNEAVVIVRHRHQDGRTGRMRWWVTKRSGTWQVYDFEDLDMGLRMSTLTASMLQLGLGQLQEIARAVPQLRDAALDVALQHNPDAAEKKLQAVAGVRLPAKLDALRFLVTGLIRQQRGQFQEALDAFDQAHRFHADMPGLNLLKGIVLNDLGQWEKALKHLEAYRALLGDDVVVCQEIADALRGLGRHAEACAVYRRALDEDPKDLELFLGFLRALEPGEPRQDLAARFAKLDDPHQSFDTCAEDCHQAKDGETLEALALAMRKIDPRYAAVDYYLALAKAWDGRADQAVTLFKAALAKQQDAGRREHYTSEFLQAMAFAGKAGEAYLAAPDARAAFRILSAELIRGHHPDELRRLLAVHRKKHADEPLLPFYQGVVHVEQGQYQLAEKSFAVGMAKAPEHAPLAQFRASRVLARYHTGQGLSAYTDIGPRGETFQQVVGLCFQNDDDVLLAKLLDAHAKAEPDSPELVRHRIRLKIRQKQFAEGTALLKAALAKQPQDDQRRLIVSDFLYDMLDAGLVMEGYQAAPDPKQAFQILAEDCVDSGRISDLRRLVEAHRARQPDDVWLAVYSAEVCISERTWDKAAEVIARALKTAPADIRSRLASDHELALYKTGRALQAYAGAEDKKATFTHLASLMATDKKWDNLEALLAAHRPNAGDDPEVFYYEARAKAFAKRPADAVALFQKACAKQSNLGRRRLYIMDCVLDMHAAGKGLDGYRAASDKTVALEELARHLVAQKQDQELEPLLREHEKHHPNDPWLAFYTGELHLLRGEVNQAQTRFAAALAKASRRNDYSFREGLFRARIRAGKAAAAYQEAGPGTRTFEDLARLCVADNNANQLEALIAAQRQADPDDAHALAWQVDAKWLRQDYEGALKLLAQHRQGLFAQPRHRLKRDSYLVRCLIKLKQAKEAVREAEDIAKNRQGSKVLLVLAHAAQGDVKETIAVVEKLGTQRFLLEDCYRDADLGPLLRGDAFREFRERFPPPDDHAFDRR